MIHRIVCLALASTLVLAGGLAHAFKLIPMYMDFHPTGREAHQTFRIENEGDQPVAVQVSMVTREMDIEGKEAYGDAEDDFLVYPPQVVLMPKQIQAVRVQWVGNPNPSKELAYRIMAEQLPVDLEKGERRSRAAGVKVNILVRYLGVVYVLPKGARPDVVLDSVQAQGGNGGRRALVLTVRNRGSAHAILGNLKVRLTPKGGGAGVELSGQDLQGMEGENILAGHRRRFVLPWPKGLGEGIPEASLDFTPWR
jgi:fimbrial chaperone protein